MLTMASLFFVVDKSEWTGYHYFFEFPEHAYTSQAEAEEACDAATQVVVPFADLFHRVASDIHHDA
jgi:hypothetical protein